MAGGVAATRAALERPGDSVVELQTRALVEPLREAAGDAGGGDSGAAVAMASAQIKAKPAAAVG
eukprot:11310092-Alexandrium_andersonii.AAC.1